MITRFSGKRATAWAGLVLYGSLLATAAIAHPSQHHSKHARKPARKSPASAALVAAGKKVYQMSRCVNCHAIQGVGGKVGPNLTKTGAVRSHTVSWFEAQVKNPKSHTPNSTMPPFGARIKGKQLIALATYLSSLKK